MGVDCNFIFNLMTMMTKLYFSDIKEDLLRVLQSFKNDSSDGNRDGFRGKTLFRAQLASTKKVFPEGYRRAQKMTVVFKNFE